MKNVPPPAEELAILDHELQQLELRRTQLLARRAWLLDALRPAAVVPPPAPNPFVTRPAETSPPSVQNLLLTLGGILLTIAAIAFTLVSWGSMGIGGRSAVLCAVTVAALGSPAVLLRRGLASTAESLAALGMVLMVLDAYALHRVALPETDGLGYTACASAVLAALGSAYGLALPRLRTPLPSAVLCAQLPLPLWALTAGPAAVPMEWALLLTAVFDIAIVLWTKPAAVRGFAGVGAVLTGGWALVIGGWQSLAALSPSAAAGPAVLLLAAAVVALFTAWRVPSAAAALSAASGLAAVAAVGGVLRPAVPGGWAVLGYLLCAVALLTVVRTPLPRRLLPGLTGASAAVHAAAVLSALPLTAIALTGPARTLTDIWSAAPTDTRGALGVPLGMFPPAPTPIILLITAAVLATAAYYRPAWATSPTAGEAPAAGLRPGTPAGQSGPDTGTTGAARRQAPEPSAGGSPESGPRTSGSARPPADDALAGPGGRAGTGLWTPAADTAKGSRSRESLRVGATCASLALTWAALLVVPAAADLGYAVGVAWQLVLSIALLAFAVVRPASDARAAAVANTALACGLGGAVSVALLSLATRPTTFTVLGVLVAALVAATLRTARATQALLACTAVLFTIALVGASAAAAGLPPHRASVVLLAVPAAVAFLGARLRHHPVALPLEVTSAAAGLVALVLAAGDRPTIALVLALCGVITAGTAVRAERRPAAGYLAATLFVLATWVRLAASEVESPEAYTLPVTIPAIAVGVLRRRRDPQASSWTAYGPGLAATLVPSLVVAWGDEHWLRPLLLGVSALVVTLAGARLRLQALLLLGAAVLALDALHELAPYVVQVVGALPRWLPPALAGLLLLVVGATYEQRLRDARRLRDTVGRMH
ncbi:SCO7613 C-terminal domain-containing membrane protein [Streptomyces sp. NPDC002889]|uniref:SCO7613 C-terminal domain-containing membrane protein n=1 Tax=Streptomyces sp. NPDC002889 TaxID=3364669 RepID=UPI00369EBE1D